MHRRVVLIALAAVVLGLAAVAQARVGAGTYSGTSKYTVDGVHVSHPFSLKVKRGAIVKVSMFMGGTCAGFDDEGGSATKIPIEHNAFKATLKFSNGVTVKLKGSFKGSRSKGSITGSAKGLNGKRCPLIKSSFTARRS